MNILLLIIVQLLFAGNFVVAKLVIAEMPVLLLVAIRFIAMASLVLCLLPFFWKSRPQFNINFLVKSFALAGFGYCLTQFLMLKGIEYSKPSNVALITSLIPIVTLFIVILKGQASLSKAKVGGFALSFIAVSLMLDFSKISFGEGTLKGDAFALLAVCSLSYFLTSSKEYLKNNHVVWTNGFLFIFAAVQSVPFLVYSSEKINFDYSMPVIWGVVYIVIAATGFAYLLTNYLLKQLNPEIVSLYAYLQPILVSLLSWLILDTELELKVFVATALLLLGFLLASKKPVQV